MNREVHVRIWERLEVRVLRATRQLEPLALSRLRDRCQIRRYVRGPWSVVRPDVQ